MRCAIRGRVWGHLVEDVQSTLTPVPSRARPAGQGAESHLFFLFQADRPLLEAAHWDLSDVEAVEIGRAADAGPVVPHGRLAIRRSDALMSKAHAVLRRTGGHWLIEDEQSKNGTRVNGAPVETAVLADGDVIELGQTFLLFRRTAYAITAATPPTTSSAGNRPTERFDTSTVAIRCVSMTAKRIRTRMPPM